MGGAKGVNGLFIVLFFYSHTPVLLSLFVEKSKKTDDGSSDTASLASETSKL